MSSIAGIFANQLGTYYDMWALRDEKYCKNDFWVDVLKLLIKYKKAKENFSNEHFAKVEKEFIETRNSKEGKPDIIPQPLQDFIF